LLGRQKQAPNWRGAKAAAKVLHNHFVKEEEFALPPVGLLSVLARGRIDKRMCGALIMTDQLKAGVPKILREHKDGRGARD
jgi:hypothetical protein